MAKHRDLGIVGVRMKLLTPLVVGDLKLPNRVLMAPLTRVRADRQHVATELIAEHYRQRASAEVAASG